MNQTTDKIIDKIKKEHLKPIPKWRFWMINGGHWAGFGFFILLTVLSLGLLWYFWADEPWLHVGHSLFFGRMPLIFLFLIITGVSFAIFDFYKTERGYKYSFVKVGLVLLVIIVLMGWFVNHFGISQQMDHVFNASPLYQDRETFIKHVWQNPDSGLITGEIVKVIDGNKFVLQDLDGKNWIIDATGAIWRHGLLPEAGLRIKIVGRTDSDIFVAQDIRPERGMGGCGMRLGTGSCGMMR